MIKSSPLNASNDPVSNEESSHLASNTGGYIVCVSVEKNLILPKLIVEFSSVLDFLIMNPLFVLVPSIHSDT